MDGTGGDTPLGGMVLFPETENLLFNGTFAQILPFHKGNRPAAWIISTRGDAQVKPWKESTSFNGKSWTELSIEYRMKAASGLFISSASQGSGANVSQNIPAYRLRQNNNSAISVRVSFDCGKHSALRLGIRFTVSENGKKTRDLDEIFSEPNAETAGNLKLERIGIPANCLSARVAIHAETNESDAYIWNVEAAAWPSMIRTRPISIPIAGIGLPRVAQRLWSAQDITIIAAGDSITEICSGDDGDTNEGNSFLHQFTSHIQALCDDNLTVRQFRNGNAGGQDMDVLIQAEGKLFNRADGVVPDLILFSCGRNEWRTNNDDMYPDAPQGAGMFRLSSIEAIVRNVRRAHPDTDLIFMVPCPRPLSDSLPNNEYVDDELWLRQNETLARTYGGNVIQTDSAFHFLTHNRYVAAQHIWQDGIHPYKPGQTIIAQHLIDFFNQAIYHVAPAYKPDVSLIPPIGPLTEVFEKAHRWRMGSPFTHNGFKPMDNTSFAAGGIKIDGVTEFYGMIGEKDGDYIEFTDEFHHHVYIYVLEFINAGKLDLSIDGIHIDTMDCRQDHYDFLWFGAMNTKRLFDITPGTHTIRIAQKGPDRAGIWYIGVV